MPDVIQGRLPALIIPGTTIDVSKDSFFENLNKEDSSYYNAVKRVLSGPFEFNKECKNAKYIITQILERNPSNIPTALFFSSYAMGCGKFGPLGEHYHTQTKLNDSAFSSFGFKCYEPNSIKEILDFFISIKANIGHTTINEHGNEKGKLRMKVNCKEISYNPKDYIFLGEYDHSISFFSCFAGEIFAPKLADSIPNTISAPNYIIKNYISLEGLIAPPPGHCSHTKINGDIVLNKEHFSLNIIKGDRQALHPNDGTHKKEDNTFFIRHKSK